MTVNILLKFKLIKSNFKTEKFHLIIFHLTGEEVIEREGGLNSKIDFLIKHRYIILTNIE